MQFAEFIKILLGDFLAVTRNFVLNGENIIFYGIDKVKIRFG
jgi:hypothetical protein